jgi:uncharacterized protein YjaZ
MAMELTFFGDAPNYKLVEIVRKPLEAYFAEVTKILPELPRKLSIWLDNKWLSKETGTGGHAYSPGIVTISFDIDFENKQSQLENLRGTVFHESYHLVQGHTGIDSKAEYHSMLDSAIYEGCATVFERNYANVSPSWGEYKQHSREELESWYEAMAILLPEDYWDGKGGLMQKWAFYDQDDGHRWKLYKTGSWVVDEAVKRLGIDVLFMRKMSAGEICTATVS